MYLIFCLRTGFYNHSLDKRGRPAKIAAEEAYQLIAPHCQETKSFEADEIIARMMIPMANEAIRCLEEGIIASPEDADMSLLYGLGFPPFRGGIFRYIESVGIAEFVQVMDEDVDELRLLDAVGIVSANRIKLAS